ncbi:transglycosylase SLT domain-containing protein [Streptomyces sp. NPDC048720]|uniref:transglycosylase SLT domain-containing protein n=1 Tax=Streptomyces sp. NPDC048720 TaxID=3365588 RepID=UPI00371007F9
MAVSFGGNQQLNSLQNLIGQIGQAGSYTPKMKLPDPKPSAALQPFAGLPAGIGSNSQVTGGTTPVGGDLGRLMRAIRGQESGGNYRATNPSGASGAYQILRSNFERQGSGWDMEALGHDVSYAQFMSSPAIQDAIARYKLGQYLQSRGMAGAAATWYGGDWGYRHMNDSRPQNGYPSMAAYVQSVLNRYK